MQLILVHHADAVGPEVDPQRSLSMAGRFDVDRLAAAAAAKGVKPAVIWHSGKLRARQTAEAFLRRCNPLAEFKMVRGLRPDDPAEILRDVLRGEDRHLLVVGHMPHIAELLRLVAAGAQPFPLHGLVTLESRDGGASWEEMWRARP